MPFVENDLVFLCGKCNQHPEESCIDLPCSETEDLKYCTKCGTLIKINKATGETTYAQPSYLPPLVALHHPKRGCAPKAAEEPHADPKS